MSYSGTIAAGQDTGADAEAKTKQLQAASKELTKMLDGIEKKLAALSLKAISAAFKTVSDSFDDSFKSMERSVTRGSQTIINAMNEARASVNKPDLNKSIAALGGMFENALGGIALLAAPVAQNLEAIASAAVGVGVALAAWKADTGTVLLSDLFQHSFDLCLAHAS